MANIQEKTTDSATKPAIGKQTVPSPSAHTTRPPAKIEIGKQTVPSPTALPAEVDDGDPVAKELRDWQAAPPDQPVIPRYINREDALKYGQKFGFGEDLINKAVDTQDRRFGLYERPEEAPAPAMGTKATTNDIIKALAPKAVKPEVITPAPPIGAEPPMAGKTVTTPPVEGKASGFDWGNLARGLAEAVQAGLVGYSGRDIPLAYQERLAREQRAGDISREDAAKKDARTQALADVADERKWQEELYAKKAADDAAQAKQAQAFASGESANERALRRELAKGAGGATTGATKASTISNYGL